MEKQEANPQDKKGLSIDQALYTKNRNKDGNKNYSNDRNDDKLNYFKGNCEGYHKYGLSNKTIGLMTKM
jgi:hypothetical protein